MPYRLLALILFLTVAALPASGITRSPSIDTVLRTAAGHYRAGSYHNAFDAAQQATESPERTFLLGMTARRLEQWDRTAELLAKAAESYPLLADFALYGRAEALSRLSRYDEAFTLLQRIRKEYPDSPLQRKSAKLAADAQFGRKDFKAALAAYQDFIEQYPSGQDAIAASFQMALCREEMGDRGKAAARYRSIWLDYPGSSFSDRADEALHRLAGQGVTVAPYTREELFQRGNTLYSLKQYGRALEVFSSITSSSLSETLRTRIALKRGQAQYRTRNFRDAERTFAALDRNKPSGEAADEIAYWHARSLERTKREEEAFAGYLKVKETWPRSPLADDALLDAAQLRKHQGRWQDTRTVAGQLLAGYPDSGLKQTALWEMGWAAYQAKDYPVAADAFKKLLPVDSFREKALYWTGRALQAAGDREGAEKCYAALREEYPLGFYALQYLADTSARPTAQPLITGDLTDLLPPAKGLERAHALIALGMFDEARMELAVVKKKSFGKNRQNSSIARLYLEMDDFGGAAAALQQEKPRRLEKDNLHLWAINYPAAFRKEIALFSARNGLDPSLVYSLIRAESGFSPRAQSPVGALGLMQLMPATARAVEKDATDPQRLFQPELNIRVGTRHLKDLIDRYRGNLVSTIASYNAGAGTVDRWLKEFGTMEESEFIENIPYAETRDYVKKVLAGREIYRRLYAPETSTTARNN
jgi:soluble lytic murein transglycosylase